MLNYVFTSLAAKAVGKEGEGGKWKGVRAYTVLPDVLTKKSMKTHNTQDTHVNYNIRLLKNARYSFILSIQRNMLATKISRFWINQ